MYDQTQFAVSYYCIASNLVIRRLGEGPTYHVELKFHFHGDNDLTYEYVTVELDGENMPHSVFTFLSQVEFGAYQAQQRTPAFWFSQVGNNTILGVPTGSLGEWNVEWPALMFEETYDQVSSDSYTLGWNGMGPELYISAVNQYRSFPNAPFGRVTQGTEVVDRMYYSATTQDPSNKNNSLHQLVHPVTLISATIL